MRAGSLFSGYGGLDLAVEAVTGAELAWVSDIDKGACKILTHHWPDVPNLGDIAAVNWSQVEPVDVLTGGFPCQDVSHAGKRAGLRPDTRSGLWSQMAYAIDQLRPSLVVAENVRGLLSAEASGDLEPCPWCVGDGPAGALRALGAVLGDLAELGYDAEWVGVRAADVGAPHGRFRVFVVAYPNGTPWGRDIARSVPSGPAEGTVREEGRRAGRDRSAHPGRLPADGGLTASDAERRGCDGRSPEQVRRPVDGATTAGSGEGDRSAAATPDTESSTRRGPEQPDLPPDLSGARRDEQPRERPSADDPGRAWGTYEPAVRRWEHIIGRTAPAPTEPGRDGRPRLSPAFVEWMMGLPPGWVCDVPDLTRNEQLKALGNGVVPQQAAAALTYLLQAIEVAA